MAQEQKRTKGVILSRLKNTTSDIVVDKDILKVKREWNQLLQALRNAELEEILSQQAAKK